MSLLKLVSAGTIKLAPKAVWALTPKTIRIGIRSRPVLAAAKIGIIPKGQAAKKIAGIVAVENVRKVPTKVATGIALEAIAVSIHNNVKKPIVNKVLIAIESPHRVKSEKETGQAIIKALEKGNIRHASGQFIGFSTLSPMAVPEMIEEMVSFRHPKAGKFFRLGLLVL